MRNLWSTTTSLLRRHPLLWLPVIAADVASFWLSWLERLLHRQLIEQIVIWLSKSHSVLGETPDYNTLTPAVANKAAALTAPLVWTTRYLGICLYTAALIATAAIVYSLSETGAATLRQGLLSIQTSRRRILIFSLKFFFLNAVVGILGSWLLSWSMQLQSAWEKNTSASSAFQIAVEKSNLPVLLPALLLAVAIATIMAPIAVRLLQPPGVPLFPQQAKSARRTSLIVVAIAAALQVLIQQVEPSLFQRLGTATATLLTVGFAVSLITAIPFVLLYVALALIAKPVRSAPATTPEPTPALPTV
jgi:hypothetical protein